MPGTDKVEDYQAAVRGCVLAAGLLAQHDLPSLLEAIGRAESVGPILDPTLYREKNAAMAQDKEVLEAAMPLWRLGRKLQERAARQGVGR